MQASEILFIKPLTIANIKCHVYINPRVLDKRLRKTRYQEGANGDYGSYLQRRFNRVTYFAYANRGCLNITGIKEFNQIHAALHTFLQKVGLKYKHVQSPVIQDNCTASAKLNFTVQLNQLRDYILRHYAPHFKKCMLDGASGFHCLRVCLIKGGSVCIFPTGSILFLAVNDWQRLLTLCHVFGHVSFESQTHRQVYRDMSIEWQW